MEDEDSADNTCKKEVKPKELLKNGMFVLSESNKWYVVVGDNFVGKDGGHNSIEGYDNDLYWRKDKSFFY